MLNLKPKKGLSHSLTHRYLPTGVRGGSRNFEKGGQFEENFY